MVFKEFSDPKMFINECFQVSSTGPKASVGTDDRDDNDEGKIETGFGTKEVKDTAGNVVVVNKYDPRKQNFNESFTMSQDVSKLISEHMDLTDPSTVKVVCAMNEAQQNTLLVSLTNKLYEMVVNKIDSIDYGEIPNTRGDIRRLHNYNELNQCITVLKDIFKEFKEDTEPVEVIENAIANIENYKDLYTACFAGKVGFGMAMYKTMTLSVINATSFMIAVCIEYIKRPGSDGLRIVLDKTGVAKVKEHLVYESLKDFNEACRRGDVENALRPMIKNRAQGFVMTAALGLKAVLVVGGVLLALIPMIRNLVYFFYAARARVSSYFDLQAKLLEMNAQELENNPDIKTEDDRKEVIRRQLSIAASFHKLSNAIAVDNKGSEVKATNDIKKDSKDYRIDDIENEPVEPGSGPLF